MKVGIDFETDKVYVITKASDAEVTLEMSPIAARLMAMQLISSADTLDDAREKGLVDDA